MATSTPSFTESQKEQIIEKRVLELVQILTKKQIEASSAQEVLQNMTKNDLLSYGKSKNIVYSGLNKDDLCKKIMKYWIKQEEQEKEEQEKEEQEKEEQVKEEQVKEEQVKEDQEKELPLSADPIFNELESRVSMLEQQIQNISISCTPRGTKTRSTVPAEDTKPANIK